MSDIVLSAATRNSLLAAQNTAELLSSTQNRLASGKKVSSALDNPLNFFTAQSLDNRASDISGLLDSISNGIQTIQAASTGITNIQKLVDSAKSTANQALAAKDTAAASTAKAATSGTVIATRSVAASSKAISATTTDGTIDFSGSNSINFKVTDALGQFTEVTVNAAALAGKVADNKKVTADEILTSINSQLTDSPIDAGVTASLDVDGRIVLQSTATGSDSSIKIEAGAGTNNIDVGLNTAITAAATITGVDATDGSTKARATGTGIAALASGGAGVDGTASGLSVQLGSGPVKNLTFTGASAVKGAAFVSQAQAQLDADVALRGKIKVEFNTTTNALTFRTTGTGADQKLTVKGTGTVDIGFGTSSVDGTVVASGAGATTGAANSQRSALAKQFNDLLTQITQLSQDASYNGVNLLYRSGSDAKENTLHLQFNEKNTSSLDIKGVKFDADGLGLKNANANFATDTDIQTSLSQLTNASSTLRAQSSTFGSNLTVVQNRQDFSKSLINTLQTGSAALVNADLNEEAANSQALTTRQSLAISSLSLANQAQQSVLQLLR